jgi:hypothetical protein
MVNSKTEYNEYITSKLKTLSQNCDPMINSLIYFNGEPPRRPDVIYV